jgi:hypothetical protein
MRSRFFITVAFSLLFLLAPSLPAAEVRWPAKLGSWSIGARDSKLADQLNRSEAQQPLMNEAGLVTVTSRTYVQGDKKADFTLYSFRDSSGAYEALTVIQVEIIPWGDKLVPRTFYEGNLILKISSQMELEPGTYKAATSWLRSVSDGVASPPVAGYLPSQGRLPASERYALGPVAFYSAAQLDQPDAAALVDLVGFNSGAEAMFAKYRAGKEWATLLLIEYPTPQLAELHLKHMQRAISAAKNGASVERKGSLLSIVLAPTSQEYAEKLRAAVNYETQVTWSEPSTTATDPPIMSTLVKIFVATGVFMVVTVVVGIAFGGVRIITKRLFPGKVFDRPEQMEVLQLGLTGKPIDPRDLY